MLRIGLLFVLVGSAVATAQARGVTATGCDANAASGLRLPAPLTARTRRGLFLVERDGRICRLSRDRLPVPANASWWETGTWVKSVHGHVLVGRWRRTLWRSPGLVPHAAAVDDVVGGGRAIAFSTDWRGSHLYVAAHRGPARLVANGEFPLGWTQGGLYVARNADGAILLRRGAAVRRLVGARLRSAVYDAADRGLYFVRRARVVTAKGLRERVLTSLTTLGFRPGRDLQLQAVGALLALQEARRLVVLRRNGTVVASTRLPLRRTYPSDRISGGPIVSPHGDVVAFAAMHPDQRVETQVIERGNETVYILRPGTHAAVPIHVERLRFNVCGHGAELSWRGSWLLYSVGEGDTALIDTRTGRTVELSSVIRRLPGFTGVQESGPLSLAWA